MIYPSNLCGFISYLLFLSIKVAHLPPYLFLCIFFCQCTYICVYLSVYLSTSIASYLHINLRYFSSIPSLYQLILLSITTRLSIYPYKSSYLFIHLSIFLSPVYLLRWLPCPLIESSTCPGGTIYLFVIRFITLLPVNPTNKVIRSSCCFLII